MHTDFVVSNGVTMHWRSDISPNGIADIYYDFDGALAYTDIVIYEDDRIIGYAVVKIYAINEANTKFCASVEKAALFPLKANGEYQDVPLNYVHERIAEVKDYVS